MGERAIISVYARHPSRIRDERPSRRIFASQICFGAVLYFRPLRVLRPGEESNHESPPLGPFVSRMPFTSVQRVLRPASTETRGSESPAPTEAPLTSWTCVGGGSLPSSISAKKFVRTVRILGLTDCCMFQWNSPMPFTSWTQRLALSSVKFLLAQAIPTCS
jgi:hypothetical protein